MTRNDNLMVRTRLATLSLHLKIEKNYLRKCMIKTYERHVKDKGLELKFYFN